MKNNILTALGLFTALTVSANAAPVTWSGGTSTAWANGANWGGTAPANDLTTDIANFNSATYTNQPSAGTVSISGITVGSSSGALTISGTMLSIGSNGVSVASGSGAVALSTPVTLGAAQTWTNAASSTLSAGNITNGGFTLTTAGSGNVTLSGAYGGAGGLTQSGTGTLKLSGVNSYTGATLVSSGTLQLGSTGALGTSSGVTVSSGATLDLNGQSAGRTISSWVGDITNSSASPSTYSGQVNAVSGTIDGTGNITLAGAVTNGTLTKNGANTVTLGGSGSDSSLAVVVNAGTLLLNNSLASGDGAIRGNLTINGGLVQYLASNQIHNSVGNVVVNNGSLDLNSFSDTINTLQIGNTAGTTSGSVVSTGGGGLLTMTAGPIAATSGTASANLGGAVGLTKTTTGTVTLSGTNTFTGAVAVNGGTLVLGSTAALGAASSVSVASGATLDLSGQTYTTALATTLTGDLTNSSIAATYAGGVTVNSGTVDGAGAITLTGGVVNGTLTKNGTNTLTLSGAGNNTSLSLVVNSGTVILNKSATDAAIRGKDSFGNALTINGGTVQLGANDQILNSPSAITTGIVYVKGGALDINSKTDTINGLEIGSTDGTMAGTVSSTGGAGALTVAGSAGQAGGNAIAVTNGTASATLAGTVVLTKSTSSAFTLSGANTYSGGTAVTAGTLYVNNTSGSGTGTGAVTMTSGATLAGSGTIKPTGGATVAIVSGATLASGSNQTANATVNSGSGKVNGTGTGGGLTLDNTEASSSLLTVAGGAKLTFDLGAAASPTGLTAGYLNFSNPNTDSTYLNLTGSTVDQIFTNSSTAVSINLVDLTAGASTDGVLLTLRNSNPYLLIQTALTNNADFANLVTTGGTGVNGYVLGVSNGTGGYTPFNIGTYDINGNLLNISATNGTLQLYLNNGDLEVVPEPGTWAMMLGGMALLVAIQRRKNKAL